MEAGIVDSRSPVNVSWLRQKQRRERNFLSLDKVL
jgi:hypothetical protein